MELKLTFSNPHGHIHVPIDYQYYLASWMYKVLAGGDAEYAKFLHDEGYKVPLKTQAYDSVQVLEKPSQKVFKLFNFSNLIFPKYLIHKEKSTIQIQCEGFSLKARFKVDKALENFIKGLFTGQSLSLKTGFNELTEFPVSSVETQVLEVNETKVYLRALSPVIVGKKRLDGSEEYLSPEHEEYTALFFNNLIDKYLAAGGTLKPEWQDAVQKLSLPNPNKVRSKLTSIRKGGQEPIRVKGYMFDFIVEAPQELIETGLLAGFGRDNAMGFGFGEMR